MNYTYKIVKTKIPSEEQRKDLAYIIKALKKSHAFYKNKLRLFVIEHETKIPMGTLGWQLRYKKISTANYLPLLEYLEKIQIEFKQKPTKRKDNVYQL